MPGTEELLKLSVDSVDSRERARDVVDDLRSAIRYHNRQYYVLDQPVITDNEYDELMRKLQTLEDRFPGLQSPDSPTRNVGADPEEQFGLVEHPIPMLSLKAVYEEDEVRSFDRSCRDSLGQESVEYIAEPKYDGLAVELTYEAGRLTVAATRGDGNNGENVTANVRTIREIPLALVDEEEEVPSRLVVRGEIYMRKDEFEELNQRLADSDSDTFANPRNAAAGSLRQLDPHVTASRPLHAFFYQVAVSEGCDFTSQWEVSQTLPRWGLKVNADRVTRCSGADALVEYHQKLADERDDLPYEIDGVVYKVNRLDYQEQLGMRSRDPRWALAYKFAPRRATTRVDDIQVSVGRTGKLTPIAFLDPVRIGGVEVSRASLHNQSEVERRDIRIGDTVIVERAGDVIPHVIEPVLTERDGSEKVFHMPDECPVCGTEVVSTDDRKLTQCPNVNCPAQLRGSIQHFASRGAMDIEGLGEKTANQLIENDLVMRISSLYQLTREDLLTLDGFADKSADKLLSEIEDSKHQTLARFLYALGIPLVGEHVANVLASHYETLDDLRSASGDELQHIDQVGPEVANSVTAFFAADANRQVLEELNDLGLVLDNPLYSRDDEEQPLDGVTVVFTGKLERWTRDGARQLVERLGGRATSSVSGETDYVVAGPGAGSKLDRARARGITVMSEDEFAEFLQGRGVDIEGQDASPGAKEQADDQ